MQLYNDYNSYLKNRYGCRVYKIGLDAGFSCPNRDGTKGSGGCLYCNASGARSSYSDPEKTVERQLRDRMDVLKNKYGARKFIAYFQAFTNTYAPSGILKDIYDQVLPFEDIVGMSIGTRPDALNDENLELISRYAPRYETWLELGLQSSHDRTLKAINRGHSFDDFEKAVKKAGIFSIPVCAHVILGLPGENRIDMINTAKTLTSLGVSGVKIHLLHILKGSAMEKLYSEGKIAVLQQDQYASLVCDFLEYLSEDIIIHRLTGEGPKDEHVAPLWALDKAGTIEMIRSQLSNRSSRQGLRSLCRSL